MKKETKTVLKNIWYDTVASPFLYDSKIYDIKVEAGILEKTLLGTDFPLLSPDRYYKDIGNSDITPVQRKQILGKNTGQLFK